MSNYILINSINNYFMRSSKIVKNIIMNQEVKLKKQKDLFIDIT